MTDYDAVIIGAGPAGATSAYFLARAGWNVAIVEKSSYPRRKVCGEFISATTIPLLRSLGVAEAWEAAAGPAIQRVGMFVGETTVSAPMPRGGDPGGWGRALGRELLDSLLLEAAGRAGARIWQPWRAVSVAPDGQNYACALQSKDRRQDLRAPVIIAAHGSWESGALPSQVDRTRSPSDLLAFKAHFRGVALEPDLMPLLAFPGGYGGMVWTDGGRLTLSCCVRRDVLADARKRHAGAHAADSVLRHICGSVRGAAESFAHAERSGAWLAAGPIRPGIRAGRADGIFRVGNVAGEAHPIVAEGISMAIQSGAMLAELLRAGQDGLGEARVLDRTARTYAAAWRRQFSGRIAAAAAFARLAMRPELTGAISSAVETLPGLLTLGALLAGKSKPYGSNAH